ncbi:lasso peptide biosynthesis PqqD family chaperone [Francisella frigiditurris]|uniref:Coenzyme PQQ synthesis D family protein n=1 Tax=Francisella frigiditurris TaxID=1542390 RepID=A0A1J0KSE4_9GAMM|nr:lasso peptide biosynthesis PqqD family chaperone [Francisella frigiditurris]APC96696.1 coenzyme PQQ synthesis D family protein [Francisella frigiditurris]
MTSLQAVDKIHKNNDIFSSEIDGEAIMMNIENNAYYSMGEIGNRVWQLLGNSTTINDICEQLIKEYDVSIEQCQKDITPFLNQLLEKNLIIKE